jgi:two-component system cell cycle response regulator
MPEQLNSQFQPQPRKWNVLLVDDEKFNHDILELFLAKTNYVFQSAKNVRDAIEIISDAQTDIVITDAMMPNESGFSLIEKLKANPQTAAIPVILWTILEQPDGSVMDATKKADFTVCKPFYHSEILETLEKARQLAETRATR